MNGNQPYGEMPPPHEDEPLLLRASEIRSDRSSRGIQRVSYSAGSHVQVIFQMYGSILPQVLPFCVTNVAWTILVHILKEKKIADLTLQSYVGHSFMGIMVSFLVVSRSKISYNRFMEIRRHLGEAYRSCRELIQFTCIYTLSHETPEAKSWRQEVGYLTILMLRVTMDALHWSSTQKSLWEDLPEVHQSLPQERQMRRVRQYLHGPRTMVDENFRAPVLLSYNLREKIMRHEGPLGYKMPVNEYRDLLHFVTSFVTAFHGFRVLVFTPYPFPLVQMTRIFLFFWVYSLPLVLLPQLDSVRDTTVLIFFMTFGFLGIEYVSMTLDDPFGDDPNDFDDAGMAEIVYEDIYAFIHKCDGAEVATELRERVLKRYQQGTALDNYRRDVRQDRFWARTV
jgi:predicted membrane chloride channel (bestrophin family)